MAVCKDVWTSGNNLCFLSMTGSFMDDNFQLQEILLGFKALEGHYIGSVLGTQCVGVLNQYRLLGCFTAITADGAGNNKTLYEQVATECEGHGIEWNPEHGIIRCLAYIIYLCVLEFLQSIKASLYNEHHLKYLDDSYLNDINCAGNIFATAFVKISPSLLSK